MKKCNYCHVPKPLSEFPLKRNGEISGNCLSCKDKRKEASKKPEVKEKRQKYYQDNKVTILEDR